MPYLWFPKDKGGNPKAPSHVSLPRRRSLRHRGDGGVDGGPQGVQPVEGERYDGEEEDHMDRVLPTEATLGRAALIAIFHFLLLLLDVAWIHVHGSELDAEPDADDHVGLGSRGVLSDGEVHLGFDGHAAARIPTHDGTEEDLLLVRIDVENES